MASKRWFSLILFIISLTAVAQIDEAQLDALIKESLVTFDVPGISVGILKDNKIVYSRGHGVRSLTTNKPMNADTKVGVASNSKGFTCFALAMMVDVLGGILSGTGPSFGVPPERRPK